MNGTAMAADGAAAANTGYTLAADWDDLSPGQRLEMGFGVALWGGLTLAVARSGRVVGRPAADRGDRQRRPDPEAAEGRRFRSTRSPACRAARPGRRRRGRRCASLPGVEIGHLYFIDIRRANGERRGRPPRTARPCRRMRR